MPGSVVPAGSHAIPLLDLVDRLAQKRAVRLTLLESLTALEGHELDQQAEQLRVVDQDIARLQETFELLSVGRLRDESAGSGTEEAFDWRSEVVEIVKPVFSALSDLTERPRRINELQANIETDEQLIASSDTAIGRLEQLFDNAEPDTPLAQETAMLLESWIRQREAMAQSLLINQTQLRELQGSQRSLSSALWPVTRAFLLGRGLTLLLAVLAVVLTWFLMRSLWFGYIRFFTNKEIRRRTTWFRILDYSFYMVSVVACIFGAMLVLALRQDVLLIGIAVLLLIGAAIQLRNLIPAYLAETRLLLNLGAVREDERVIYNGLPWQVMSINVYSVLRNPELDGIVRLSLSDLEGMISRPVDDELWFPTSTGDYVVLSDGLMGRITRQTPELVELSVKGGTSMTYPTEVFYAMNIINLTRNGVYGVGGAFGLDYGLQPDSLDIVPQALRAGVETELRNAGLADQTEIMVELQSAGASSLDYLVWVTCNSEIADQYYRVGRLIQQACVRVANERDWEIPFPQMVVHQR